ncbi:MAG: hypothetical protein MZV64_37475 [Ignavibacteriales bacterium]|nr:hypothetical protein [Ignavibacteriales bacterium]
MKYFLEQAYSKKFSDKSELLANNSDEAKVKLELFNIMFGPFDRTSEDNVRRLWVKMQNRLAQIFIPKI